MKSSNILFIFIIFPSINCFFIRNPFRWFQTNPEPQNLTVSSDPSLEPTESTINLTSLQDFENVFNRPINQMQPSMQPIVPIEPIQPFPQQFDLNGQFAPPDRPIEPLTLSRLGMPVKVNRFGLEPLSHPFKSTQRFRPIVPSNPNSLSNMNFHRRLGDLAQSSTQRSIIAETKDAVNKQLNPIKEYSSTLAPTEMSTNYMTNSSESEDNNEYQTDSELLVSETIVSDTSPMPVYKNLSTESVEQEQIGSTTPMPAIHYRPTFLYNQDFANQFNNMYYNKPLEMFEPVIHKYNPK